MIKQDCTVRARAYQQQLTTSSQKQTPGIQIMFRVTEGEYADETVRFDGWFTEKTAERIIESLNYCGWTGDDLAQFSDGGLHGLDTNDVELVIEMEDYHGTDEKYLGKQFPKVQWINRLGGRGLNVKSAMTPDAAAAFGEKFRGLVLKARAKAPQPDGTDFNFGANAPPQAAAGGKRF